MSQQDQPQPAQAPRRFWERPARLEVILASLTIVSWSATFLGLFQLIDWEAPQSWVVSILLTLLTFSVSGRLHAPGSLATRMARGALSVVVTLLVLWIAFVIYMAVVLFD